MSLDQFLLSADTTDLNYPEVRPTLDLNFARVKALDPRITFTRASGGSYVGADGLIKYAGVNEARFDHDPYTGESLGLLIEEARTNLLLRSEEFGTTWGQGNITISPDAIAAPNGTLTADKSIATTTNGAHQLFQGTSGTSGVTYTISFYVKEGGYKRFRFGPGNAAVGGSDKVVEINLALSNPIVSQDAIFNSSAFVISVGNGWYRVGATFTATATGTMTVGVLQTIINNAGSSSFAGDGTSGIYIWGAQLEAGAFPTSYIPTEASTRTRAADDASMTGKNFSDFYRQDEGTVYFDGTIPAITNDTIGRLIYGFSGGFNFSNSIYIGKSQTSLFISPQIILNNVGYILISFPFPSLTSNRLKTILALSKFNISCKSDLNSSVVTASTTIPNLPTVDRLQLGAEPWNSPNKFNRNVGTIKRFTYYPKRLTDAQLQVLTR